MTVPILLVAGYLGAGKTTLVNDLLRKGSRGRIAAIVNDFGDIEIDAMLLSSVSENLISLKNGCICCSLQGDLLATLSRVLKHQTAPDAIVIETSGVADPAPIAGALLDPVIFRAAALDTIVTLVDAAHLADNPSLADDALWHAQLRAADFALLTKTDLVEEKCRRNAAAMIRAHKPGASIFETVHGAVDPDILFSPDISKVRETPASAEMRLPQFETISWSSRLPLSLAGFQRVIGPLAAHTLRIKGLLTFAEQPNHPMLFQCVGLRATLAASPAQPSAGLTAQLVLIGRQGAANLETARGLLQTIELRG